MSCLDEAILVPHGVSQYPRLPSSSWHRFENRLLSASIQLRRSGTLVWGHQRRISSRQEEETTFDAP